MLFLQQFNKIAVMDTIQIKDKRFTPFIPEERILKEVARVASEINRDLEGTRTGLWQSQGAAVDARFGEKGSGCVPDLAITHS